VKGCIIVKPTLPFCGFRIKSILEVEVELPVHSEEVGSDVVPLFVVESWVIRSSVVNNCGRRSAYDL
jgi:hypothetical protein